MKEINITQEQIKNLENYKVYVRQTCEPEGDGWGWDDVTYVEVTHLKTGKKRKERLYETNLDMLSLLKLSTKMIGKMEND